MIKESSKVYQANTKDICIINKYEHKYNTFNFHKLCLPIRIASLLTKKKKQSNNECTRMHTLFANDSNDSNE